MIESIPVTHAMEYIRRVLHVYHLSEHLLNDFKVSINSETGWNGDDFDVEVIFHDGPRCSFSVYGYMGNLDEQFFDGLRNAVLTLTKYVPKIPEEQPVKQLYFTPKKRIKILNSRFRPKAHFKPSWEH